MALLILSDDFDRTLTEGWGTPPVGGAYALGGDTTRFSVSGGAGHIAAAPARSETAYVNSISRTATRVRVSFSSSTGYAGGIQSVTVGGRVTAGGIYQARARIEDGLLRLYTLRDEATLAASTTITHTYTPGQIIWLEVEVVGVSPTTVRARMWLDGQPEPAWQQTATDSTAGMQVAGAVTLRGSVGGTPTTLPTISLDSVRGWDPSVIPLDPPVITLAVTHPTVAGGTNGAIAASWGAVSGATGYDVALVSGTGEPSAPDETITGLTKTYSGLGSGVWTVAVRARA